MKLMPDHLRINPKRRYRQTEQDEMSRSNVVTWLTSKAFGVRPLAAVKPTAFLFCAVRLAMPLARLSDRLDAQKGSNCFASSSSCALAGRMSCSGR